MRVKEIRVAKLFGRFDYVIPMNLKDRITIVHGPNGVGKTMLLRLVAGLFSANNQALRSVPYERLEVELQNGKKTSILTVSRARGVRTQKGARDLVFTVADGLKPRKILLRAPRPEDLRLPLGAIDQIIPELEREGPEVWRHQKSGEFLSLEEVVDRFGEKLPVRWSDTAPGWLDKVRHSVPVWFIQADRLQGAGRALRSRHSRVPSTSAVMQYSRELGVTIKQTLTDYAALSQSLDRTFPARMVNYQEPMRIENLQAGLREINDKRARLVSAGLLEEQGEETPVPVPTRNDNTRLAVLSTYVQDTNKKLSVFDPLVAKVELFKRRINDRFLHKQVSIGQNGFRFTTSEGIDLDPLSLSSGEQHEVVLIYELLFKAVEDSLILLDEPEISLHVAWQEQFLPDLQTITELSRFDALIATHSTQIIGDRWDLTVRMEGLQHGVRKRTPSRR